MSGQASIAGLPREVDDRYRAHFFEAWDVRLDEALPLVRQTFLQGDDRYRVNENYLGLATAPLSNEGAKYDYFAPSAGKETIVTTDIYKFGMKATEELRLFGRSRIVERYPELMAAVMDHTVKVMIFDMLNRAFNTSYPTKYDTTKPLCATDHPLAGGGTGSNALATPADLSETTAEAMLELLARTPNETGIVGNSYKPRLLVTSQANWGNNVRLTGSEYTTDVSSNRGPNTISAIAKSYKLQTYVNPLLSDADATFLLSDQSPINVVWARLPVLYPGFVIQGTDDWAWHVKMQLAVIADNWRGIIGTAGA